MSTNNSFGVLYFVDDNPHFTQMLNISITSLRRFHPDWPVRVLKCSSFPVPLWKQAYRSVSFWKWKERHQRAQQDWRVIFAKASGMIKTPFERTLYLDADTVILKPLSDLASELDTSDVIATPLFDKCYSGHAPWQPSTFPMLMAGVVFYNRRFIEVYQPYVAKLRADAGKYFAGDQFMFSLVCDLERGNLKVLEEQHLQIDAINLDRHLEGIDYPKRGKALDITYEGLRRFHIFHYNGRHKRAYIHQIQNLWELECQVDNLVTTTPFVLSTCFDKASPRTPVLKQIESNK